MRGWVDAAAAASVAVVAVAITVPTGAPATVGMSSSFSELSRSCSQPCGAGADAADAEEGAVSGDFFGVGFFLACGPGLGL